ncbi:MAG: deoxyribodipyrimidine photo-lyase [Geminicoccaceae bacterium]
MTQPTLVWFRNDLRLADNPALGEAVAAGGEVVPVYILDDAAAGQWRIGGAARWWLHHSLASLQDGLAGLGFRLRILRGDSGEAIDRLLAETKSAAVFWNRRYEPWAIAQDKAIKAALEGRGVRARSFNAALGREPWEVARDGGQPYKVFTPFWRAWERQGALPRPLPAPEPLGRAGRPDREALQALELLPTRPDWAGGLREAWQPGEPAAQAALADFLDGPINRYAADRNYPAKAGVSRLSPRLHHGELSPRQVWHAAHARHSRGAASFVRELVWREFCHHLLFHFPDIAEQPLRPEFADFPWADDRKLFRAWARGRTGYPLVDAGMRELWHTGYLHNRVRMVVASFLTKDLLIPWQQGAAWFWDTLCDADLANNSANWQWVAGSGTDAAPYFRIFNPVSQGEKFDLNGDYVRRWVPELAKLPGDMIQAPWDAPADARAAAGVTLGKSYPERIVDHARVRERALAAYRRLQGEVLQAG